MREILKYFKNSRRTGTHCAAALNIETNETPHKRLVIVGNPNVGKSVIFNRLTGAYVTVSNYPGTTVEVARGKTWIGNALYEVVDTPGLYSLRTHSEEESVARALLLNEPADIVLHVIDAKNLERMLVLTLELVEAGLPVALAINMMDEADRVGLEINFERMEILLGVPVCATVARTGRGISELRKMLDEFSLVRSESAVSL
jgi:ferrous iron transport protein B